MNTKLSVMVLVNMRVMMMETGFVKSMSTRWRDSSPLALLVVRIVAFLRKSYRCTWVSSSLFTIPKKSWRLFSLTPETPIEPYLNGLNEQTFIKNFISYLKDRDSIFQALIYRLI